MTANPFKAIVPISPEDMVAARATELLTYTCTTEFDRIAHTLRVWGGRAGVLAVATIGAHKPAAEKCTHPAPVIWHNADLPELTLPPETSS